MIQVKMSLYLNMHDILKLDEVTMRSYTLFFTLASVCKCILLPEGGVKILLIVTCDNRFKIELYNNHSNKGGVIVQI